MDKMAAGFIEEMLAHIRFDTITDRMLYGRFYGYAVAEVLWMRDGTHVVLDQLKARNRRRFVFAPDFKLKLVTTHNPDGEALPDKKFWSWPPVLIMTMNLTGYGLPIGSIGRSTLSAIRLSSG